MTTETERPSDFIRDIVADDLRTGKYKQICTRFPPEPNGYLHIGHAKSICLNFGIAREFGGICNVRMDDTNPIKEEAEYVESIMTDVRWLIDGWADKHIGGAPFYASDYFDRFYEYARRSYTQRQSVRLRYDSRGNGRISPAREGESLSRSPGRGKSRSVCANESRGIPRWRAHVAGEDRRECARMSGCAIRCSIASGTHRIIAPAINGAFTRCTTGRTRSAITSRASRIRFARWNSKCTGRFTIGFSSALELPEPRPHQYEFARLNLTYSVMSKRKLIQLVNEKLVSGWDDPRMLTISGLRRRGVTASALRAFAYNIGITKYPSMTDMAVLEHTMRDEFNRTATRRLAVLRPIKVVLTNYPEGKIEELDAINNPEDPNAGTRKIPFSRELYIESDDFMETPPPKYFRLRPGGEVRLKYAYIIKCDEVVKDAAGNVTELRCTVDLDSKSGGPTAGRKVKGTIHWVSAAQAIDAEVRLYDRLFSVPEPDAAGDFKSFINPNSLEVVTAKCEPALAKARPEERYQFERLGYFALDPDSTREKQVWNRTITLRDTWAKEAKRS